MRFIKPILVFLFFTVLLISLTYSARLYIFSYGLDDYLTEYQAKLTCVDFTLTSSLNIIITKACIDNPHVNIEINDIHLTLSSAYKLEQVKIRAMAIKAKTSLVAHYRAKQPLLPEKTFKHYLAQAEQFILPIPITVKNIIYSPYHHTSSKQSAAQKTVFYGQVITNKTSLELALKNSEQVTMLTTLFSKKGGDYSAQLNADVAQIQSFLALHHLSLPDKLGTNTTIEGQLTSDLSWNSNELTANTRLENFEVNGTAAMTKGGLLTLSGMLSWKTELNGIQAFPTQALITIEEQSTINLGYNHQALVEYLTKKNSSDQLIKVIEANPTHGLTIKPNAKIAIDLIEQKIQLSNFKVTSKNQAKPLQLTLSNADLSYQDKDGFSFVLHKINYLVATKLALEQIESLTKEPVIITSAGTIKQLSGSWQVILSPSHTQIELSKIKVTTAKETYNQLASKALITHWQGELIFDDNGLAEFDLQHKSQALKLNANNMAMLEQVELTANIAGKQQNINITADITADKQPIANIKINGNSQRPYFTLFADNLALTDLLTLNLNLPVKMALIDGTISYTLKGQLTDTVNWLNNASTLTLTVQGLTGEIDNTWIQEVNWTQKLLLTKGEISTVTTNEDDKKFNHFTIAKVDTAPPLSELSGKTNINLTGQHFTLTTTDFNAKFLGGKITINKSQWPLSINHSVYVQLTSIDLTKLLELDPKQGIIVTGNISGDLPISFDGKKFTIIKGELHNISKGIIKIADNPTVEQLKVNDPQLKLAFDAMQNLHYHLLTSDVSMDDSGYMLFDTRIKGRNPDIDNDVNLNLNLNYDLMGLLESLNITSQIEQNLIDSLQKK